MGGGHERRGASPLHDSGACFTIGMLGDVMGSPQDVHYMKGRTQGGRSPRSRKRRASSPRPIRQGGHSECLLLPSQRAFGAPARREPCCLVCSLALCEGGGFGRATCHLHPPVNINALLPTLRQLARSALLGRKSIGSQCGKCPGEVSDRRPGPPSTPTDYTEHLSLATSSS